MQTLLFNVTNRTAVLYEGSRDNGKIIESFYEVPTVRVESNYYQIMQKFTTGDALSSVLPVMRLPISNTNMIIVK